jgi:hypothetical protein
MAMVSPYPCKEYPDGCYRSEICEIKPVTDQWILRHICFDDTLAYVCNFSGQSPSFLFEKEWLKVEYQDKTLRICATEEYSDLKRHILPGHYPEPRKAEFVFDNGYDKEVFTFMQEMEIDLFGGSGANILPKPWTVHFPKEGGSMTIHTLPSEWYFVELCLGDDNPYLGKRYSYGSPYPEDQLEYMYPIEEVYTIKEYRKQERYCYRPYSKKIEWVTVERTDSINFTSFTITVDSNTTGKDRSYAVMLESAAVSGTQSGN